MAELDDIISAVDETQRELLGWLRRFREELRGGGLQSEFRARKMLRRHAGHLANIGLSMKPLADRLRALTEVPASLEAEKLELKKCPGCNEACELTAECDGKGEIRVSIGGSNELEITYHGDPIYRVVCMKCETHLVSASIMGLPASTPVVIVVDPVATITTLWVRPGGCQFGSSEPQEAESLKPPSSERASARCGFCKTGQGGLTFAGPLARASADIWVCERCRKLSERLHPHGR